MINTFISFIEGYIKKRYAKITGQPPPFYCVSTNKWYSLKYIHSLYPNLIVCRQLCKLLNCDMENLHKTFKDLYEKNNRLKKEIFELKQKEKLRKRNTLAMQKK